MKTYLAVFLAGCAMGALGYGFRLRIWQAVKTLVGRGGQPQ